MSERVKGSGDLKVFKNCSTTVRLPEVERSGVLLKYNNTYGNKQSTKQPTLVTSHRMGIEIYRISAVYLIV
jgi:hypothetical protein